MGEKITAISLFAGAGGMDVGFQKAGVQVIWANELDEDAAKTYANNNPETILNVGDIRKAIPDIRELSESNIDLVFGGPPCQGFSVAGKMDPKDERSKLIWDYFKVVEILKPKYFIMENVKALAKLHKWSSIRNKIIDRANDLGYNCFFRILNAADYGVPQNRERVFFVGYKEETIEFEYYFDDAIENNKKSRISLRQSFHDFAKAGTKQNPITCSARITLAVRPVLRKSPYAGMLFNGMGRPLDLDSQANTLPASMGGNKTPIIDEKLLENPEEDNWIINYHKKLINGYRPDLLIQVPKHIRRITINEAAHIQTFPERYIFKGRKSSIYRQIGNAVPCNLAEAVAKSLISASKKSISLNVKQVI